MGKKLPELLNTAYDKGYHEGHRAACQMVIELCQMSFCIAMNDALGIGAERFERVRNRAMEILGKDFVDDPQLSRHRMEVAYKAITGEEIEKSVNKSAVSLNVFI